MTPRPLLRVVSLALTLSLVSPQGFAAPNASSLVDAKRTVQNKASVAVDVSRNIYRTESYQENYTERVAYQEQEYYTEEVPYEETETYTENEDYYEWERICKDHTEWEKRCETKVRCEPRFERRCEMKKICQVTHLPGALQALLMIYESSTARADNGHGQDDRRKEEERRQREHREREQRDRENRERENRDREAKERQNRERQANEREAREREAKERENREREKQARERENREREAREREARERQANEREAKERENRQREKEAREREAREREAREREARERAQREAREREQREKAAREARERAEREAREREQREKRCNVERCENVKVGEDCSQKERCENIPKTVNRCENEYIRKTRPVVKTRKVVKYRSEYKSRWVTRYRNETRCCVTKTREIYERTYSANVELKFPADAELVALEQETFAVQLNGAESTASVVVSPLKTFYTYIPEIQQVDATHFVANMKLTPTYQPAELGLATLKNFKVAIDGKAMKLTFSDEGVKPKVHTAYQVVLIDPVNGAEVFRQTVADQINSKVALAVPVIGTAGAQLLMKLQVDRSGVVINGPVSFAAEQTLTVVPEDKYDPKPFMDKTQVGKFSIGGSKETLIIYFRDLTPAIPQVRSEYQYKLFAGTKLLSEKTFKREDLTVNPDGKIPLAAGIAFEIPAGELALLGKGTPITIDGQVVRYGSRFPGETFAIPKKVTLIVP